MTGLCALSWALWFTGPIAAHEVSRRAIREPIRQVLRLAGDRDLFLYHPNDGLRGGVGFYRGRTALEYHDAPSVVERFRRKPDAMLLVHREVEQSPIPTELVRAAVDAGMLFEEQARLPYSGDKYMVLISASRDKS